MPADALLLTILAALGTAAIPVVVWVRAQKRIHDLEMTLLARTTDADQYEELKTRLDQLTAQTEQLVEQQALLAARLGERRELPALPRPETGRAVTPH